jgi:hypothetical protein
MPTAAVLGNNHRQRSHGIRRNARTVGWHEGDKAEKRAEGEAAAYSIVRPELRQFELSPGKEAGTAVGSLDSGTASALHSPRSALPHESPFPEFC